MKKLWEIIKAWFIKKWNQIKTWFITKPWVWFKKNWFMVINYIVIVLAYNNVYSKEGVTFAEVLLGLWIFASIAYAVFKWFMKKPNLNPQPEPPKPEPVKPVKKTQASAKPNKQVK